MTKTLKQQLQENFEKEGFFIPSMPRDIDYKAIATALNAVNKWLTQRRQENEGKKENAKLGTITWYNGKIAEDDELLEELKQ